MADGLTAIKNLLEEQHINFLENEPMKGHTTFLVGGAASLFINPTSEGQIAQVQSIARKLDSRLLCLGRGSNLLVADSGLPFAVLHLGEDFSGVRQIGTTELSVLAGTSLISLCNYAKALSLTGLEFAYGIPGSVGGAIYMNAGAYGGEISSVIRSVNFLDQNGKSQTFTKEQLDFSYRHSYFSGKDCIILSAEIELYHGDSHDICNAMETCMQRRRDKQPLEYASAGSTFKRPDGAFAGALIEQCGLKGYAVGGARVSEKHAGFVINTGHATSADIVEVIRHVRETVLTETGYLLEPEIMILP